MKNFILTLCLLIISYAPPCIRAEDCEEAFLSKNFWKKENSNPKKIEDKFHQGLSEAHQMLKLGERLRKRNAQAYTTHIKEFAAQIFLHYEHFKKDVEGTYSIELEEKISKNTMKYQNLKRLYDKKRIVLDYLLDEALRRSRSKNLTYAYWLQWNIRLTVLASTRNMDKIEELRDEFYVYIEKINNRTRSYKDSINKLQTHNTNLQKQKLEILDELKQEALQKVHDGQFNLLYWTHHRYLFHYLVQANNIKRFHKLRDGNLKSNTYRYNRSKPDSMSKILISIEEFPNLIALPTTKKMGIVTLNQFTNGVVPLGLGGLNMMADGQKLDHFLFMVHDLNHHHIKKFGYPTSMTSKWMNADISKEEFHRTFLQIIKDYSYQKKMQAHIAYFIQEHENYIITKNMESLIQNLNEQMISTNSWKRFKNEKDLGYYMPEHINKNSEKNIKDYLNEIFSTYQEIIHQVINIHNIK